MTEETIFTKIIKGEIPSFKVYEDDWAYAFLDIHPIQPGHTLVVPKNPVEQLWDLPQEDYRKLMDACKLIATRLKEVLKTERVGMQLIGIDVPHTHVHLIPFNTMDEYRNIPNPDEKYDSKIFEDLARRIAI